MSNLQKQAIQASLESNWEIAIDLNNLLLEECPTDLSALNRLARAYTELGQKESAKTVYQKVLSLDKYNSVATKSLRLLPDKNGNSETKTVNEDFVEETGITKSVSLIKTAAKDILLSLCCRQQLLLSPRSRLIAVTTENGQSLGCLPDDLSLKLKKTLSLGYKYTVCLKSATDNSATIFIREIKRPARVTAAPTFGRPQIVKKDSSK